MTDSVILENSQLDIDMKKICNCRFAKTLSDCKRTCGRYSVCYNAEVADDILRRYKRIFK